MGRKVSLRPWNVKPGDRITVEVLPFESVTGKATYTVVGVERVKSYFSGESYWNIWVNDGRRGKRLGGFYRDDRVEVERMPKDIRDKLDRLKGE